MRKSWIAYIVYTCVNMRKMGNLRKVITQIVTICEDRDICDDITTSLKVGSGKTLA